MPDYSNSGAQRERQYPEAIVQVERRKLRTMGYHDAIVDEVVIEGSSGSAGVTALDVSVANSDMSIGEPGIPVSMPVVLEGIASSWVSGNTPSGDWTATVYSRNDGGPWVQRATATVETS